jgi:hypothetical protein
VKVGKLTVGLLLVGVGAWLFLRRSAIGAIITATTVLIILWWGVR